MIFCVFNERNPMYEAFVIACLWNMPPIPQYCEQLKDLKGPYKTHDQCLTRVYEIINEMPLYRPHMRPKGYRCDKPTSQTKKQRT